MPDVQGAPQVTGSGFTPVMGNFSNFGWGNNPLLMDPGMQQAMLRQQYAQSLLSQGGETTPLRSPWQAAARVFQGALGGYYMGQSADMMQQYANQSRQALADAYSQQPIPQLPGTTDTTPGSAPLHLYSTTSQAVAPGGGGGGTPGQIDPAALVPKDQARAMIAQRESKNQNVYSDINVPGFSKEQAGSGYYQFIPSTWAEGQKLAGIPPEKQTATAIQASKEQQDAVFNAVYDKYGVAPWRQSSATNYVTLASATSQPGGGGGGTSYDAIKSASDQAAQYGIQLAQQYRQMAINAAQSPYAAVRALAPQFQQQSISYAGYGKFTPVGMDPNGQIQMLDRQTGEVHVVGAPVQVHTDPRTGALITTAGATVAPGIQPVGGGEGGGGPVGNVSLARSSGVPVAPGNPYSGMSTPDQQKAAYEDRTAANKEVAAGDPEAEAAKGQLITLNRMQQIAQAHPEWLGTGPGAVIARHWASLQNNPLYQEFTNLQAQLIPAERMGSGISRVTNKDMDVFGAMAPNMELDGTSLNNALQARMRQANLTLEANRFQHDYVDANGSLRGAPGAWDSYMSANPIFVQNKDTGKFEPNPNWQTHRAWFQANTDPKTGLLTPGSRSVDPNQPGQGTQQQQPPATSTVPTGHPPPFDASANSGRTATGDDGSKWLSDGKQWVKMR